MIINFKDFGITLSMPYVISMYLALITVARVLQIWNSLSFPQTNIKFCGIYWKIIISSKLSCFVEYYIIYKAPSLNF